MPTNHVQWLDANDQSVVFDADDGRCAAQEIAVVEVFGIGQGACAGLTEQNAEALRDWLNALLERDDSGL
jgi:hypothetical protein